MPMSLGKHTLANLTGVLVPLAIALVTIPFYISYIGTERFGVLAVIWAVFGYFGFFDVGLGRAVTQRMSKIKDSSEEVRSRLLWTALSISFLLGLVGSFFLWLTADYIINHLVKMSEDSQQEASDAIIWLLMALPLLLPGSALSGALHARLKYIQVNLIQVIGSVLTQLLPLVFAMSGFIELGYLLPAVLMARFTTTYLMFRQCQCDVPLKGAPVIDRSDLTSMLSYGGWISVMSILAPLLVTVDRLVIATLSGARYVAYYTVPYDLVARAMLVSGSLSSAIFPRLASAVEEDGRSLAFKASAILVAIMTPLTILGFYLINPFLVVWLGAEFATKTYGVGELILLGVWINAIVIPHHARFLATENPRTVAMIFIFELPIYFFLLWLGITKFGIVGAAAAWSLRVFLDTAILLHLNKVLNQTIKATYISLILVLIAGMLLILQLNLVIQIFLVAFLIGISLAKDRNLFVSAFRHLYLYKKFTS
jgi:O-antigen/teichoic acid export membrane protein